MLANRQQDATVAFSPAPCGPVVTDGRGQCPYEQRDLLVPHPLHAQPAEPAPIRLLYKQAQAAAAALTTVRHDIT